ncbi:MAG: LysR family transcriptional regulator [Pseudomonadota bacterium]
MDDLKGVRVFLEVARLGSFAEAARQGGTTPATATRTVAALERSLGVQLLVRTTRQVSLTAAGAAFAARMAPILEDVDRASAEARGGEEGGLVGRIRLTAPMSFGLRVLPDLLNEFRKRHSRINLETVLTDEFVDIVGAGFDLAVRISTPPTDKSTIWRKLCVVERVLVAKAGAPATLATSPQELSTHELYAHSASARGEDWKLSGPRGQEHTVRAGTSLSTNNGDFLAKMLERGTGVALLPRFIVKDEIKSGALVVVLPEWQAPPLWLTLYYPPYERLPPLVATFSDFFERYVTVLRPIAAVLDDRVGEDQPDRSDIAG